MFFQTLIDFAKEHWLEGLFALLFAAAGWLLGKRRARRSFQKREYYDRINFSLNILRDGKLQIRTLAEMRCEDVFLNAAAAADIMDAATRTTADDCILALPEKDYWQYLNAVLNEVSERFAAGFLKQDLGLGTSSSKYVIALTSEASGELRTRKVRAMIVREEALIDLPEEMPQLENPKHHVTRWETLQFLATRYRERPAQFLTVEICL